MVIFHSYGTVYQRVSSFFWVNPHLFFAPKCDSSIPETEVGRQTLPRRGTISSNKVAATSKKATTENITREKIQLFLMMFIWLVVVGVIDRKIVSLSLLSNITCRNFHG